MKQALILIDIQQAFLDESWGQRNNPDAEINAQRLLEHFRNTNQLIIHVKHVSDDSNSVFQKQGNTDFLKGFKPHYSEKVIEKRVNSAFIGTNLENYLRENDIQQVVIAGLTLPHCVSTTTRMAGNLGFDVKLIHDACASFQLLAHDGKIISADEVHYVNLAALNGEFCQALTVSEYLNGED